MRSRSELLAYLRTQVARYMVPRSIDFIDAMPRLPTGKLYKQALRDRYARRRSGRVIPLRGHDIRRSNTDILE